MSETLYPAPSPALVEDYAQAFARELDLLRALVECSRRQCEAAGAHDHVELARVTLERQRTMDALIESEERLGPWRAQLAGPTPCPLPMDRSAPLEITAMHRAAHALVAKLAEHDALTRSSLDTLLSEARADAQIVEAAEVTLAAYKRVVAPPPASAELVDQRG
jgi:hypothetical protein